jgi:hypothetical protein
VSSTSEDAPDRPVPLPSLGEIKNARLLTRRVIEKIEAAQSGPVSKLFHVLVALAADIAIAKAKSITVEEIDHLAVKAFELAVSWLDKED